MLRLTTLFLFILPLLATGQSTNRLSLKAKFAVLLPTASAEIATDDYFGFMEYQSNPDFERHSGYSYGLQATYPINERMAFGSGLSYVQRHYQMGCYCDLCDKLVFIHEKVTFQFLEIPLFYEIVPFAVGYWLQPSIQVGISGAYLFATDQAEIPDKFRPNSFINAALDIRFAQQWSINLHAGYTSFLNLKKRHGHQELAMQEIQLGVGLKYQL